MKNSKKEIQELESNERGFFSIWSDLIDFGSAKFFLNRKFPDDILFNRIIEIGVRKNKLNDAIDEVIAYFNGAGVRPSVFVTERSIEDYLVGKHFKHVDDFNVMKLRKFMPDERRAAEVSATDASTLTEWVKAYMTSFDIAARFEQEVLKRSKMSLKKGCTLYLAKVRGEPAGTTLSYYENGITGIYCVGTLPKFRGRGIASKMLEVAIRDSGKRGDHVQCLQNLEGDKVREFYEKRGFETVFVKRVYQK
ncbi:MAG: GNAT family N-acetyltransferase [Thaumarchaeota archaeon]|nr:GNAT family N-acetyltransferase [Nitrososphaerota archaeon]